MWWIYALGGLIILILYSLIRNAWGKPQAEITKLKKDIETLQKLHKEELTALNRRLQNSSSLCIQDKEFSDIILTYAWKELSDVYEKEFVPQGLPQVYSSFAKGTDSVIEPMKKRFREALDEQYRYQLSPMAKNMASYLGIQYVEGYEKGDYPCIKCNIGHGKNGEITKIYHLPFD